MKSKAILVAFFLSISTSGYAEQLTGKLYLSLEGYNVAEAGDKWKDNTQDAINGLVNISGYDTAAGTIKTNPGFGGRIGVKFPFKSVENADWGISLNVIKGPSSNIKVHAESTLTIPGNYTEKIDTSFFRLLLDFSKSFPLGSGADSNQTRFALGASIGAAQGRIEDKTTSAGSFVTIFGADPTTSDSKTWTGFTWEISPSLIIPSGTTEIEIGAKLAGFPKLKESDTVSEFNWTPMGVFCAIHFDHSPF